MSAGARALGLVLAACSLAPVWAAEEAPRGLHPLIRIEGLPGEGCGTATEPSAIQAHDGLWAAFNYYAPCGPEHLTRPLTTLQVQRLGDDGRREVIPLPDLPAGHAWSGDPDLAVSDDGRTVYLSALTKKVDVGFHGSSFGTHDVQVRVARWTAGRAPVLLPPPSSEGADKPFLAVQGDSGRERVHLVWDSSAPSGTTVSTFRNGRWQWTQVLQKQSNGHPDVAVGEDGLVAVAYETKSGVAVRVSSDGGRTFQPTTDVIFGAEPGRPQPECPLVGTVGLRQRVLRSPRVAFDGLGRLHVVAALDSVADPRTSEIVHAVSLDASHTGFRSTSVGASESGDSFAPAVAASGDGVTILYLETALERPGEFRPVAVQSSALATPLVLADWSPLPPLQEASYYNACYGIGDYTAAVPTATGTSFLWGSADAMRHPSDTDVLLRHAPTA